MARTLTWDIFCDVVDNFGDAAICWRLARQLAREHKQRIRLFCNNIPVLEKFSGSGDANVAILPWDDAAQTAPGDVVIEAFACALPAPYITAMAKKSPHATWINLEHLALEEWSSDCHGLPSPHPPLTKFFFFPGFWPKTGGLIREQDLLQTRDALLANKYERDDIWKALKLPVPPKGARCVSMFAYENAALKDMFDTFEKDGTPTWCFVPEGRITADISAWFGAPVTSQQTRGNLTVVPTGFFTQDEYDRLLWLCDLNFVRGEDSIVRAVWAGKPFIWAAYQQKENAHFDKVAAFLDILTTGMPSDAAASLRLAFEVWNGQKTDAGIWAQILVHFDALRAQCAETAYRLAKTPDCVLQINDFVAHQARLTSTRV